MHTNQNHLELTLLWPNNIGLRKPRWEKTTRVQVVFVLLHVAAQQMRRARKVTAEAAGEPLLCKIKQL